MPERDKAVFHIIDAVFGPIVRDPLLGTPRNMPRADHAALEAAVDELFVGVVDMIDWGRILMTANARHMALRETGAHEPPGVGSLDDIFDDDRHPLCPSCMVEALLSESTMGNSEGTWKAEPNADRDPIWRTEFLEEAGGKFKLFQRMIPRILERLHKEETDVGE